MVTLTLLTFACSHPDEEPTQKSETPTEPVVKPDTTQTTPPDTIQTTPRDTTMGIGASLTPWEEDPNDGGGTAK